MAAASCRCANLIIGGSPYICGSLERGRSTLAQGYAGTGPCAPIPCPVRHIRGSICSGSEREGDIQPPDRMPGDLSRRWWRVAVAPGDHAMRGATLDLPLAVLAHEL